MNKQLLKKIIANKLNLDIDDLKFQKTINKNIYVFLVKSYNNTFVHIDLYNNEIGVIELSIFPGKSRITVEKCF